MSSAIIYSQAIKIKADIERLSNDLLNGHEYEARIKSNFDLLNLKITQYDSIARKEISLEKRNIALNRVEKLRQDYSQLFQIVEKCRLEQLYKQQELQRVALLGQQIKNRSGNETCDTVLDIDMREAKMMNDTASSVHTYVTQARGALTELYEQREMMKVLFFVKLGNETSVVGCCK
jgi:Golgi SNAP receptor complex protein 2